MKDKFNAYLCPVCKKVHPALECKDYKAEIKNSEFIEFDIKTELLYQQGMSAKLNYLINKLIEARQEIENEKSENERLIKDGQYLTEQINLKDKVIEAAIKWRNDTQTISIEECCPGIIEKCDECELVRAIDKLQKHKE